MCDSYTVVSIDVYKCDNYTNLDPNKENIYSVIQHLKYRVV